MKRNAAVSLGTDCSSVSVEISIGENGIATGVERLPEHPHKFNKLRINELL